MGARERFLSAVVFTIIPGRYVVPNTMAFQARMSLTCVYVCLSLCVCLCMCVYENVIELVVV